MREKVARAINLIRPGLQADGGDIELLDVNDEGEVKVCLIGACVGYSMSPITFTEGVERAILDSVPEVKRRDKCLNWKIKPNTVTSPRNPL